MRLRPKVVEVCGPLIS